MRDVPRTNPNRGKRRLSYGLSTPRTSLSAARDRRHGTTGVTVTMVDPSYLRRYGSERAIRHADAGTGIGGAVVIGRNLRRRSDVRAAAALVRESRS